MAEHKIIEPDHNNDIVSNNLITVCEMEDLPENE